MKFESLAQFADEAVKETLKSLPRDISQAVAEIPIFLEPLPTADDVATGIEADTLGLFDDGEAEAPTPRIRLWLLNIWDYAEGDEGVFREEVSTTLLHEIGHLVGWNEEDLEERGLG